MLYKVIDEGFDKIFDKYGFEPEIMNLKQILIKEYENKEINTTTGQCYFQIDKNGRIKSL